MRSRRLSRRSCASSLRSGVLRPSWRLSASSSACLSQRRTESVEISNSRAISDTVCPPACTSFTTCCCFSVCFSGFYQIIP